MVTLSAPFNALRALLSLFPRLSRVLTRPSRRQLAAEGRERDYEERLVKRSKDNATLSAQLAELQQRFRRADDEHATRVRGYERSLQEQRVHYENKVKDLERERTQLQQETRALSRQLEQKTKHLEQLSKESSEAQKWMSIRDKCTDAQIVSEVEGLNYEVQNISMPLADALADGMQAGVSFSLPSDASLPISARALATLQSEGLSDDMKATLLGIALQSALVGFCREAAVQWEYGFLSHNRDPRLWLDTVFNKIHSTEPAAISGNWRSLVHRHAARVAADTHGNPEDVIMHALLSVISPIVAGCGLDAATTSELIESSVGMDALTGLATAIKRLNDNIKQGVVSSSLVPIVVNPDVPHDAATMKVGLGGDEAEVATVLSTTGLGLERVERKEDGTIVMTLLLPPEVAVNAVLDSL